jgi:hypothetical protein
MANVQMPISGTSLTNTVRSPLPLLAVAVLGTVFPAACRAQERADQAFGAARTFSTQRTISPQQNRHGMQRGEAVAPELFMGELQDVGPQFLVSESTAAARATLWEAGVDTQFFYSSNVLLTERHNIDTGILVSTFFANFTPMVVDVANGKAQMRLGYRHQLWSYSLDNTANQLNNLDFGIGTLTASAIWTSDQRWFVTTTLEYSRYMSREDNWAEFYTEFVPSVTVERVFNLGNGTSLITGYIAAYHFTNTASSVEDNANDRLDSTLALTVSHEIAEPLFAQVYVRALHSYFTASTRRDDYYLTTGANVIYAPTNWLQLRLFANYEARDSKADSVTDYCKWDTGIALTALFRF